MLDQERTQIFENARPNLLGLAYRILGSLADAEDAVQDTYLKWVQADRDNIDNAGSWLTTVCTRRCLDVLQSANRSRVTYVGNWLPEPVHTAISDDVADQLDLATSLTTAFLLTLERLTPKERAAYLLHEIFDLPYPEISSTLELQESTCRKLVSRAKINVEKAKVRHKTPVDRQDQLLEAFKIAITEGETKPLTALLSTDIKLTADGGGKVPTLLDVLQGKPAVLSFLVKDLHEYWHNYDWRMMNINGARGIIIKDADTTVATVSFSYDETDNANNIFIVRNPEKISNLNAQVIH